MLQNNNSNSPLTFEILANVKEDILKSFLKFNYSCKKCSYQSASLRLFYEHCLCHIKKKIDYVCSVCSHVFTTAKESEQHMREIHKDLPVPSAVKAPLCSIEIIDSDTQNFIKKGKDKLHENGQYLCHIKKCQNSFSSVSNLVLHKQCHIGQTPKVFCCPSCTALFHNWPSCAQHMYEVHDIDCGLKTCLICERYKTCSQLKLENHMRIHGNLRAFTCKTCGKSFKQASQLRSHFSSHFNEGKKNKKKFKQCTTCFKMYSTTKALKKHKDEVHNKLRPFVCNVCGHASARKAMLVLHQRQHTGHKSHKCSDCDYNTGDHNSLRRHIMRHTGVRPYHCRECNFSTITSSSLKRHALQRHSGVELFFSCKRCSYKTVSEDNYVRHVSDHLTGLIKESNGRKSTMTEEAIEVLSNEFPSWMKTLTSDKVASPQESASTPSEVVIIEEIDITDGS